MTTPTFPLSHPTKNCTDHSDETYAAEWLDRRYPFVSSLRSGDVCVACLDALEADEFVELVEVAEYPN